MPPPRVRAMHRFRQMKALQKFVSVHANAHNRFSLERHLVDRETYKQRRSAALAEWQILSSQATVLRARGASCGALRVGPAASKYDGGPLNAGACSAAAGSGGDHVDNTCGKRTVEDELATFLTSAEPKPDWRFAARDLAVVWRGAQDLLHSRGLWVIAPDNRQG